MSGGGVEEGVMWLFKRKKLTHYRQSGSATSSALNIVHTQVIVGGGGAGEESLKKIDTFSGLALE